MSRAKAALLWIAVALVAAGGLTAEIAPPFSTAYWLGWAILIAGGAAVVYVGETTK